MIRSHTIKALCIVPASGRPSWMPSCAPRLPVRRRGIREIKARLTRSATFVGTAGGESECTCVRGGWTQEPREVTLSSGAKRMRE